MNKLVTFPASGEDRISALPDDIICNILSNLYVEESTRTSILSKRWHKMWLLSPITISDESIVKQSWMYYFNHEQSSSWIVNVMSHVISTHPGPVHTCHFTLGDWEKHHETLVNLLKALTLKGIQNLQIDIRHFDIPCFVLECESLVNVRLRGGSIRDPLPARTNIFPNLKKLILRGYNLTSDFLVNLFSSTSIIHLALFNCYGVDDVVIESDSLQKFVFKGTGLYVGVGLTITNVPNLESFECDDLSGCASVAISNAPKLKVLSRIDVELWWFKLGNHRFDFNDKHVKNSGEITYMPSLRSLDIAVDFNRGCAANSVPRILVCILVCFPCLETLEVNMKHGFMTIVDDDYDDYDHLMSNLNCLNHHLKNVRITDYLGGRVKLDFVRLIIANAKVLETLTIVYGTAFEERWMKAQKHFLMQNRASKMLRVEFVKKKM